MVYVYITFIPVLLGRLRRHQSHHRPGQGDRLLLRHLRRARHRAAHPDHRQQLRRLLQERAEEGAAGREEAGDREGEEEGRAAAVPGTGGVAHG